MSYLLWVLTLSLVASTAYCPSEEIVPTAGYCITDIIESGDDDTGVGKYTRSGNKITYTWKYKDHLYSFWVEYVAGYHYMQSVYNDCIRNLAPINQFIWADPFQNSLKPVAGMLKKMAKEQGVSPADLALSFVQALPYDNRNNHLQRFAAETLIDCRGDCSDTSVLLAGLFTEMNLDCVFFEIPARNHMAVGLWSERSGVHVMHNRRKYVFCETTGTGWEIGTCSDNMLGVNYYIHSAYSI